MYTYKTEILTVGTKWLSDKADAYDIANGKVEKFIF